MQCDSGIFLEEIQKNSIPTQKNRQKNLFMINSDFRTSKNDENAVG